MKIVLCGGGSGGHFYPLIAITESIRDIVREKKLLQVKMYYLAPNPYNAGILFDHEIEFVKISAGKIRRYASIQNIIDIIKTGWGFISTLFKVYSIYPDVIISKGGMMSLPVVVAGKILGIPVILHESDSVPGRANLFAAKFAKRIAIAFKEAGEYFDRNITAYTGNPLRQEILTPITDGAKEYLKLEENLPTIVVMGGSLGSALINETLIVALPELLKKYQIIHQTGKLNFENVQKLSSVVLQDNLLSSRYHLFDYLNALSLRMSAGVSSIIISRGGSTIFEIAAWGVPSIIIPLSDSNGDHQRKNAYNYARESSAIIIEENNLTPEILITEIENIITNKERSERMRQGALHFAKTDAARKIAEVALDITLTHEQ